MNYLKEKINSDNLKERIIYTFCLFLLLFISMTILSHYILPQGIIKGKIPTSNIETSNSLLFSAFKIFLVNLVSIIFIFIGSLFSKRKNNQENYHSIGYDVFFVLIIINAITLGTWSFNIETNVVPDLSIKILEMFNIFKRAGLWEMIGQMFITCSIANIGIVLITKGNVITKNIKDIKLSKIEKVFIILGFLLMLIGALIESILIISQV